MMDRLLALKKAIREYLRLHPSNGLKLTSHEWTVINEECSVLDIVSEATTRIQGAEDTHVSQAMFIITEIIELLKKGSHPVRVANATVLPPPPDGIPTIDPSDGSDPDGARRVGSTARGDGR